jgi:ABC-type transporter Mla subunit MlaD
MGFFDWFSVHRHLVSVEGNIMSAIGDFADRMTAFFEEQGPKIDTALAGVTGIAGDVAELKRIIEEIQNSPGPITTEDQARLDALEALAAAFGGRVTAVVAAVTELDEQTPPAPPA